ncbi:MAG TPA: tetratricopeptide repeat protein, partial [Burkholderiales bacterium]|nr:tetratricopeptide repeat protein [Burkholderiales bacterium]
MRLKSFIGTAIRRITGAREREAPAELAQQVRDAIDRNAHELALRLAHEALARFPGFAELHYLQGLAMHSGSDPERALTSLERAVELEPEHAEAWNSMASVLQTLGRIGDARTAVERAVALGLNPALAHHNLGILAAIEGNLELACHHFGLATAADPGFATAHFNLGKALNDL